MKILTQNKKMKNTSVNGAKVFNFGIPAFRSSTGLATCPQAGACAAGCYAKQGAYLWGAVKNAYEGRLQVTLQKDFADVMTAEIAKLTKRNGNLFIRIHDSGDFYNAKYLTDWLNIMARFPEVKFYAYTKMIKLFQGRMLPANFTVIYSLGGKQDSLIDQSTQRHSRVFDSIDALHAAGYVDTSSDDLLAIGENKKIGLVYHGAKSFKNTLWNKQAA